MDFVGLAKHTFTLATSCFDVCSDVLNGLTFLGYYNAPEINVTATVSDTSHTFHNKSVWINSTDENAYSTSVEDPRDVIWGTVALIIIFLPGIISGVTMVLRLSLIHI